MPDQKSWSAQVWRRAAARPYPPARLTRVADLVVEGKTTWGQVATGQCEEFAAQMLTTAKGRRLLAPLLDEVAAELAAQEPQEPPRPAPGGYEDEECGSWLVDAFDLPSPRWAEGDR